MKEKSVPVPLADDEIIGALATLVTLTLLGDAAGQEVRDDILQRVFAILGEALLAELSARHPEVSMDNLVTSVSGGLHGQKEKWLFNLLNRATDQLADSADAKLAGEETLN